MIGNEQIRFYREYGYLLVPGVFDAQQVGELRDAAYRNVRLPASR